MEIYKEIPKNKTERCVSIGKFDGVHLGHVTLLEELVLCSQIKEYEACVFTFSPYPEDYLNKNESLHLNTKGEIISSMDEIGVDSLITVEFDERLRNMSAEDFIKDILISKLNAKCIVCGTDVSFGKDKKGDAGLLKEMSKKYGFEVEMIDKIEYKGKIISSSGIIEALKEGRTEDASEMLGYDYYHYGPVLKGEGLGHRFDVPTVNIDPVKGRVIPKHGVYFTLVEVDEEMEFKAITNVGVRPTVSSENKVNIESHLIDCPRDFNLYGRRIRVYFLKYLREEREFESDDALFEQIKSDINEARLFFEIV